MVRLGLLLTLVFLVAAIGWGQSAVRPKLGLTLNVPEGGGETDLIRAIIDVRAMGFDAIHTSVKWSDLEAEPGRIGMEKFRNDVLNTGKLGFDVSFTFQIIDTNNRTLPPDLAAEPFDSPKMLNRLSVILRSLVSELPKEARWINIGNEVDVYLALHPDEVPAYARLVSEAKKLVKSLRPDLAVGVTTTYEGVTKHPDIVRAMNAETDIATFTYYEMDFKQPMAANVEKAFAGMMAIAAGKPVNFQELGSPASTELGSSEERQAQFFRSCFDQIKKHSPRIGYASFFLLVDFSPPVLDVLQMYYGISDGSFRQFLGTLGLKKSDGTPRASWQVMRRLMRDWTEPDYR